MGKIQSNPMPNCSGQNNHFLGGTKDVNIGGEEKVGKKMWKFEGSFRKGGMLTNIYVHVQWMFYSSRWPFSISEKSMCQQKEEFMMDLRIMSKFHMIDP